MFWKNNNGQYGYNNYIDFNGQYGHNNHIGFNSY